MKGRGEGSGRDGESLQIVMQGGHLGRRWETWVYSCCYRTHVCHLECSRALTFLKVDWV